ncbi:hypothetical protein AB0M44_23025, partial [Streptosporangium subroseum]|uniref:hypothetical protein n=1 Tax=Streptosporangium subroseum TaxID=106412 RepID=UPI00341F750B
MNQPLISQHIHQRPIQMRLHMQRHLIKHIREHRERLVQTPTHTNPLRPLPREQERHPAGTHGPGQTTGAGRDRVKTDSQRPGVTREYHRPMRQHRAPSGRRRQSQQLRCRSGASLCRG